MRARSAKDMSASVKLQDELRGFLSPESMTVIAASLDTSRIGIQNIIRELRQFKSLLIETVGENQFQRLSQEMQL